MASSKASDPEGRRQAIRLNLTSAEEQKSFLRAILPEFLRVVDPTQSGFRDVLLENEVITDTDNSSLSGKEVFTRKDQARKLFILLDKIPFNVFMEKVAPELCSKFYHIIPDKFKALDETETQPVLSPQGSSCLRHDIQNRLRPAKIADILCEFECIDMELYSAITDGARKRQDVWSVMFKAFLKTPPHNYKELEERMKATLTRYYVNIPDDFPDQMAKGLPCLCEDHKAMPPEQNLTFVNKVGSWLLHDKQSSSSAAAGSSSVQAFPHESLGSVYLPDREVVPTNIGSNAHRSMDDSSLSSFQKSLDRRSMDDSILSSFQKSLDRFERLPDVMGHEHHSDPLKPNLTLKQQKHDTPRFSPY